MAGINTILRRQAARKMAVALFNLGSEPGHPTIRIQMKGYDGGVNETDNGGMCFDAMVRFFDEQLEKCKAIIKE